jgi:hypothetical protein
VTLLSLAGLVMAIARRAPWRTMAAAVLAALVLQPLLYGSWNQWSLGWSYGARWAADCLMLWVWGRQFSALLAALEVSRRGVCRCAVFVAVSVLLIVGQILLRVPQDGPLHIGAFELF